MEFIHINKCVNDFYESFTEIGEGKFSKVYAATKKETGEEVAIKVIRKKLMRCEEVDGDYLTESKILTSIDHHNIIKLHEVYEEESKVNLIFEYMEGGDLHDRIVENECFKENEASHTMYQILKAVKYLHERGIIHRDIKPENLIYETKDKTSKIKLADFGTAGLLKPGTTAKTPGGTPMYVAPEILSKENYSSQVDVWSLGVLLYILLGGYPPFYIDDDNNESLFELIKSANFSFCSPDWDEISFSAKNLISQILVVDPEERLTAAEVMEHPWFIEQGILTKTLVDTTGTFLRIQKDENQKNQTKRVL